MYCVEGSCGGGCSVRWCAAEIRLTRLFGRMINVKREGRRFVRGEGEGTGSGKVTGIVCQSKLEDLTGRPTERWTKANPNGGD